MRLLAFVLLLLTSCYGPEAVCYSRWQDSGYRVEWDEVGGCRVEVAQGMWLAEELVLRLSPRCICEEP